MPRRIFVFDPPERFVAGAIGEPGQRVFYLQAREGDRLVSVLLEKVQVAALADRLGLLIADLQGRGIEINEVTGPAGESGSSAAGASSGPSGSGGGQAVGGVLEEPVDEAFRAGTLSIAWDTVAEEVILEARELRESDVEEPDAEWDDDDPDGPDILRVRLQPSAVAAFVEAAHRVVAAGRPPCPWCGEALEPTGHFCTRRNGHRAN